MLRTLHIRDFVIVDQAEIHFDSGFTVFSGETGAGKSILIDALSLALGSRGDAGVLREGASKADITAIFDVPASLHSWLQEHEIDTDDQLLLRRVIDSQGRSRSFINGLPVALGQLRELAEHLVDIHGQHAHQSLLKPASQRDLLDQQGGHLDLARQVQHAWQLWQAAEKKLATAKQQAATHQQERERLEWQLSELDRLNLQEGEWDALTNNHNRLAHAQTLLDGTALALAALDDEQGSALVALKTAAQQISHLLKHDGHLQDIYDAIESARIAATEAVSDLNSYLSRLELDPQALEQAEQRLSAIFDMARQFKIEPAELLTLQANVRLQLEANQAAADITALTEHVQQAQSTYLDLAAQLSKARQTTSKRLSDQVTQAMQTLAMQGGRFDITLTPVEATSHGMEAIEFLVAGHAGTRPAHWPRLLLGVSLPVYHWRCPSSPARRHAYLP